MKNSCLALYKYNIKSVLHIKDETDFLLILNRLITVCYCYATAPVLFCVSIAMDQYATPCHSIASATFRKPAIFAPATRLSARPNSFAVFEQFL